MKKPVLHIRHSTAEGALFLFDDSFSFDAPPQFRMVFQDLFSIFVVLKREFVIDADFPEAVPNYVAPTSGACRAYQHTYENTACAECITQVTDRSTVSRGTLGSTCKHLQRNVKSAVFGLVFCPSSGETVQKGLHLIGLLLGHVIWTVRGQPRECVPSYGRVRT